MPCNGGRSIVVVFVVFVSQRRRRSDDSRWPRRAGLSLLLWQGKGLRQAELTGEEKNPNRQQQPCRRRQPHYYCRRQCWGGSQRRSFAERLYAHRSSFVWPEETTPQKPLERHECGCRGALVWALCGPQQQQKRISLASV